jgi:hypothetical protein
MPPCFLECRFHLPAQDKPPNDLLGPGTKIGAEQGLGGESALRSRTSTQRMGTAGNPVLYQTAVADATSTVRSPPPYQSSTVAGVQVVEGSSATILPGSAGVRLSGAVGLSAQLCVVGQERRALRPDASG